MRPKKNFVKDLPFDGERAYSRKMAGKSEELCPRFHRAIEILGRRWTGLIVQALTQHPRRFADLASYLDDISERMLSERLKELATQGIVERVVLPTSPVQVEYRLTEKGAALEGVMRAIGKWADAWIDLPGDKKRRRA
jgi:DNA-binding HxlR family transcriptional regulator